MSEVQVRSGWVLMSVSERSYAEVYPREYTEQEARSIDPERFVLRFSAGSDFSSETALGMVIAMENSGNFPKGSVAEHLKGDETREFERAFLEEGIVAMTKRLRHTSIRLS